jgi:hypothetical protein
MSYETTSIELERPEGWKGEVVDMRTFDGEVDYFECEVEASAVIEIDNNYGADADGNRGVSMDFSYVEDISVFLEGDFRPKLRKLRDFFLLAKYRLLSGNFGGGGVVWETFADNREFTRLVLTEDVLDGSEVDSITEDVLEKAADYEPDDDRY